jgi:hypothetical protein
MIGFAAVVDHESSARGKDQSFSILSSRGLARSEAFVALDRFTCPKKISAEPGYKEENGVKTQRGFKVPYAVCGVHRSGKRAAT